MKLIKAYYSILNQIKSITNDEIESRAETDLIFGSNYFKKYHGTALSVIDIFGKYSDLPIKNNIILKLEKIIEKRSKGVPIQYILDEAWFFGHKFHVYIDNKRKTLIPRNETEMIVTKLIKDLKKTPNKFALDIGTGSCNIPISTILNSKNNIYFDAIDPYTFEIAKKNISNYKLNKFINLYKYKIEDLSKIITKKYDYITANLPYISNKEKIDELKFEPDEALYAKQEGHYFIKILIELLPKIIKKNGIALIEIDPKHTNFLKSKSSLRVIFHKDYNNLERVAEINIK